jgi:hypothetical protein
MSLPWMSMPSSRGMNLPISFQLAHLAVQHLRLPMRRHHFGTALTFNNVLACSWIAFFHYPTGTG